MLNKSKGNAGRGWFLVGNEFASGFTHALSAQIPEDHTCAMVKREGGMHACETV